MRIVFFFNQYNLGHSTTAFSLIKDLKLKLKNNISIVAFQSGGQNSLFPFNNYCKIFILPGSLKNYSACLAKKRASLIIKILNKFKPHIFFTEFYPFISDFGTPELPFILNYVKNHLKAKIIGSCSSLMWDKRSMGILREFYDQILFNFPKTYLDLYLKSPEANEDGKGLFRKILNSFSGRICFTGFVLNSIFLTKGSSSISSIFPHNKKRVLVSRGGGEGRKKAIIINSLLVARKMRDCFFTIVTGPVTTKEDISVYKNISVNIPNTKLFKYVADFRNYLKACDLTINMAGYNTVIEALWLKKKSITIPYHTEEQRFRAYYLNRIFKLPVIFPEEFNPARLEKAARNELSRDRIINIEEGDFKGIENSLELIGKF